MNVPFVDLSAQYRSIETDVNAAMAGVLQRCDFILGGAVEQFEDAFAAYCDTKYGVGLDSGTSALEMVLKAYGIGPGDEVITAANTFIATVLAISYVGAIPVLVDVDPDTYMMEPELVEAAITTQTKALMPVHLYGHPVDMDAMMSIADRHGLLVIEDASQAHGARYKGKRVGSIGHASVFSLYPAKNLGGYGDAGVVVTNDAQIAAKLKMMRNYGQTEKYFHVEKGFNRRLDTLQAAVLNVKLSHLDDWNAARRRHAARYDELLPYSNVIPQKTAHFVEPVYHLYVIRTKNRTALQVHLKENGVATGIHYPTPIHLQPAYQDLGYQKGQFPITEQYANELLSLPMYAELSSQMVDHVVDSVKVFAGETSLAPNAT